MSIQAIVFDAYGTLFDVRSIGMLAEKLFPGQGAELAGLWRDKQAEYTRLRTMCAMYKPFWEVTQDALVHACSRLRLNLTLDAHSRLMGQYARPTAFPECRQVLTELKARGLKLAVLSNGNPDMLRVAMQVSGMQEFFHHVLSADTSRMFKPAPDAYQLAPDVLGLSPKHILYVSGTGWDACGAAWFGYATLWVNRTNEPLEELGQGPVATGTDMHAVMKYIEDGVSTAT
jgi:2-haloacid dehalogenase